MSRDHAGAVRGFHHTGAAWYGKPALSGMGYTDSIHIGMYHPQGGTSGEFSIKWIPLSGRQAPRLEVFNDAWDALERFRDLLAALAVLDGKNATPQEVCSLLVGLGIEDLTARIAP